MSNFSYPFVSVIIPVLNDVKRLKSCLEALEEQTYPNNCYEVIVVDNGSDESTEKVTNLFKRTVSIYEGTPGSYSARNKGISIAKGEIIAFTDSDCIPAYNWLETGVNHLTLTANCGLVGGKIEMFFKKPNSPTAIELYDSITYFQQKKYVEKNKFAVTANLFTFKTIFDKVGRFNSDLKSGGDMEWGKRVFRHGFELAYADNSHVAHPARRSFSELVSKVVRVSRGHYQLSDSRNKEKRYYLFQLIKRLFNLKLVIKSAFRKVNLRKELKSNKQKTQVFFSIILMKYIYLLETIKLQLNKKWAN